MSSKEDVAAFKDFKPASDIVAPAASTKGADKPEAKVPPPPPPSRPAVTAAVPAPISPSSAPTGRTAATPLAKKLAAERNLDLSVTLESDQDWMVKRLIGFIFSLYKDLGQVVELLPLT